MSPYELESIQKIAVRLDNFETNQEKHDKEFQNLAGDMDILMIRTGKIHTCLVGTEYDSTGGLVKKVECHEERLDRFSKWKTKVTAVIATVSTLFTGAAAYFTIFKK